jgi:hypothetical protein
VEAVVVLIVAGQEQVAQEVVVTVRFLGLGRQEQLIQAVVVAVVLIQPQA